MGNGFPIGACLLKKEVAEKIVQSQLVYVKACSLCNKNLQVDQLLHQKSEIFALSDQQLRLVQHAKCTGMQKIVLLQAKTTIVDFFCQ